MNIKFCYKDEIHKTFFPPANFKSLLEEIKTSFGDRLPSSFILQYKDKDGDLITMSSDLEYSSMLRFDTPRTRTSFKIFIVPSDKPIEEKEASFELIEASQSSSEDCIREFSLSPKTQGKLSRTCSERNMTPARRSPSKYSQSTPKSLSFSDCDGEGSELMSPELELPPVDFNTELSQLYKAREMIIQECLNSSPPRSSHSRQTKKVDKSVDLSNPEDHSVEGSLAMKEIDKFMADLKIKKERANLMRPYEREVRQYRYPEERVLQKASADRTVITQIIQPAQLEFRPSYANFGNFGRDHLEKIFTSEKVEYQRGNEENLEPNLVNSAIQTDSTLFRPVECKRHFESISSSSLEARYTSPSSDPEFTASLQGYGITLTPIQMYSYQPIVGLSSSILFLTNSEGQGTAYKTVYLKNTGMKPWKKCLVKPAGVLTGKTVEVSNVEVGNIALVTLELMGCFNAGIYHSQWKVVHENEYGVVESMGEPFDVEFVIEEASIIAAKRDLSSSAKYESFSEDKSKTSTEGTFREDSEEDEEDQGEDSVSAEEENIYGIGGPYSKEYLEYRDQITNKAKEIKKIFPDDTPDEIIRFVMERSELNFEDLLVAYLTMKDGDMGDM